MKLAVKLGCTMLSLGIEPMQEVLNQPITIIFAFYDTTLKIYGQILIIPRNNQFLF